MATTEIYPYGHTPSPHDALPISCPAPPTSVPERQPHDQPANERPRPGRQARPDPPGPQRPRRRRKSHLRPAHHRLAADPARRARCRRRGDGDVAPGPAEGWRLERSEEHTSELQSLMRISYAVFCLKTKKHYSPTKHHTLNHYNHTQLTLPTTHA